MTKKEIQADMLNEYVYNMDLWWILKQAGSDVAARRYHGDATVYQNMLEKYFNVDAFQIWLDRRHNH